MDKNEQSKKKLPFSVSLLLFLIVCVAIAIQKVLFKGDMGSMFLMLWVIIIPISMLFGYKSSEMEEAAIRFSSKALAPCFILLSAGALISCWIAAGTTPALIYYGIKLINPKIFLVSTLILCSIVSLFCGTSSGTIGTAGVAMMGIGNTLGIPAPITAGAVICGAFFGDKMSPMSDTTILASSISEVDIFKHVRYMVLDQLPLYIVSIIFFLVLGINYGGDINSPSTQQLLNGLDSTFKLGFPAFIPLIVTGVLLARRQSALLSILGGAVTGVLIAILYQNMDVAAAVNVFYKGFHIKTDIPALAKLLNRGGVADMWGLAGITLFGFTVAGMLDYLGVLQTLAEKNIKYIHSPAGVTTMTVIFGILGNAISFSQNFAIVMTGTLMRPVYTKYNLQPKCCSRDLEAGGTYGALFIPWNANTVFAVATLGVSAGDFLPYIPLIYLTPILVIVYAAVKFKLAKIYDELGYVDVTDRLARDPEKLKAIS